MPLISELTIYLIMERQLWESPLGENSSLFLSLLSFAQRPLSRHVSLWVCEIFLFHLSMSCLNLVLAIMYLRYKMYFPSHFRKIQSCIFLIFWILLSFHFIFFFCKFLVLDIYLAARLLWSDDLFIWLAAIFWNDLSSMKNKTFTLAYLVQVLFGQPYSWGIMVIVFPLNFTQYFLVPQKLCLRKKNFRLNTGQIYWGLWLKYGIFSNKDWVSISVRLPTETFFLQKNPYYTTYLWVKNKFCDVGRNYDGSGNEWQWISKIQSHEPYG